MGQLIYLDDHRSERSPSPLRELPAFFFDVADPLSYLAAERVERLYGEVDWVPVQASRLAGDRRSPADARNTRARADACARSLRLPLVWPDRFPAPAPRALRACAFAAELGAGGSFALAASRLAFCGGFDVEDPETLAEAAAAAGLPLDECMEAAGETWRDEELEEAAELLGAEGVRELPVLRIGRRWVAGDAGPLRCDAFRDEAMPVRRRLAPVH